MTKAHLRLVNSASRLTLCEVTAPVQDYRGKLLAFKLCHRCSKRALDMMETEIMSAEMIGVREIL
jgi:hypothetical protein